MTAIAGVVARDGRPADADVRRMLDVAAHRGAQAAVTWSSCGTTLGHRASVRRNGAADAALAADAGGNAIVFDGRLDNRDDLCRALGTPASSNDAAVALAAYAKWADESPARLLGDFAFAIWDAGRRRLFCARDVFGQRPLFYATGSDVTAVASEPRQLLAHPGVPQAINHGAIAEFLACAPMTMEETIWSGVTRLPPAHALAISVAGTRCFRYWDFDPDAQIAYARDEDYADHFLALFREAIASRTKGAASVGVFLSGGLDSSAVAGVAQARARADGVAPVRAFSVVFPGLALDESPYIDAVVRQWNLPSVRLDARSATRDEIERDLDRYDDLPTFPNGSVLDPLRRRAAPEVDVLLTGYGGDDWFTGSPLHTADLLRAGRWVAAAQQYRHDAALPGRGYTRAGLLRTAVAPLLPRPVRRLLRPLAGARPTHEWIRPEFAARVALSDRLRPAARRRCRTFVQAEMHMLANSAQQAMGDEREDRAAAAAGLDQRHPFTDRRLAEFGFALPEPQRWARGETKVVLRRALEAVLPPCVRARNDKAEFTWTLVDTIETLGGRSFLARLQSADAGWVDGAAVLKVYDRMTGLYRRGLETYIPLADALWSVAAVELWLRRR